MADQPMTAGSVVPPMITIATDPWTSIWFEAVEQTVLLAQPLPGAVHRALDRPLGDLKDLRGLPDGEVILVATAGAHVDALYVPVVDDTPFGRSASRSTRPRPWPRPDGQREAQSER